MSANSSFMATNWPEVIFAASFAVIGGSAEERTTAWPCLAVLVPSPLVGASPLIAVRRAGRVASDCVTPMAGCCWSRDTREAMSAAGGSTPSATSAEQRGGKEGDRDRDRDRDRGRGGKEEVR